MNKQIIFLMLVGVGFLIMCAGCTQVVVETRDIYDNTAPLVIDQEPVGDMVFVKVNTLFKDIDFGELWYKDVFGIGEYQGTPQDVDVWRPWGWMRTVNPGGGEK